MSHRLIIIWCSSPCSLISRQDFAVQVAETLHELDQGLGVHALEFLVQQACCRGITLKDPHTS